MGVLGGRVGQALLGSLPAGDGVGQAAGDLLPFPGGVGADLVQVTRGGLADPGGLGPGILGLGPGRSRALPGLLGLGAGLVAGGLGGPDEVWVPKTYATRRYS